MKGEAAGIGDLERRIAGLEGSHRRLLRLPEVLHAVGVSRSEWYRLIKVGRAPRSIPLGVRIKAWDSLEIERFVVERVAARDKTGSAGVPCRTA